MEHKLVIGGEQWLPFARSCVVKLKKLGLPYADQSHVIEGVTIRVRIEPGHEYIHIDGGGTPHGFLVTSGWSAPAFYKHIVTDKANKWAGFLPAGKWAEKRMTYNALNNADMTMPMVINTDGTKLRTYGQRLLTHAKDIAAIPLHLNGVTRFGHDNDILSEAGKTLYEVEDSGYILVNGMDEINHLPFDSIADGSFAVYNSWRSGVISPTFNLVLYKFCSEVITPSFTRQSRKVTEFTAPIAGVFDGTSDVAANMGEFARNLCHITMVTTDGGTTVQRYAVIFHEIGEVTYLGGLPKYHALWGVKESAVDLTGRFWENAQGFKDIQIGTKTSKKIDNILTLAGVNSTTTVSITNELNYTVEKKFRAGWSHATIVPGFVASLGHVYGLHQVEIDRAEAVYTLDGTPKLTINAGWCDIRILEGTAKGSLTGHKYTDRLVGNYTNLYLFADLDYNYVTSAPIPPTVPSLYVNGVPFYNNRPYAEGDLLQYTAAWEAALGPNIKQRYIDLQEYWNRVWFEYDNETPENKASFDYTSRYVIDYDHKSQFYACIRVKVECSETGRVYQGRYWGDFIDPVENPTYTVEIAFEWNWQGALGEKVLIVTSGRMPAFSFIRKNLGNPYRWPTEGEFDQLVFWLPPTLTPPPTSYEQLATLGIHQGANTHYAGSEASSIPGNTKVPDGVLYSTPNKHNGIVPGMLYCRNISLTDVGESLWMLGALCIDAPLENAYSLYEDVVLWHYFPQLGADIHSKKFHIELRDGALVQWSDGVPVKEGSTRPTAEERTDVSLYVA